MNWSYIIVGGAAALIGLETLLYTLFIGRKNATIETLTEKNRWLKDQLEQLKGNSPDALVEKLAKRISIQEAELERLSKDYETNESLIKAKEEELQRTKELQAQLESEIERHLKEYSELEDKVDICPYCGAELIELTYIEAEADSGTLRNYACGYSEIDGRLRHLCPADEDYPELTEFKMWLQKSIIGDEWFCTLEPLTQKARLVSTKEVSGKTEKEAQQNMISAFNLRFKS